MAGYAEITVEQYSGFNGEAKTMHTALTESDIDAIISKMYFLTGNTPRQI